MIIQSMELNLMSHSINNARLDYVYINVVNINEAHSGPGFNKWSCSQTKNNSS